MYIANNILTQWF